MYGGLARSTAGSRFPCTATSWPRLAQAVSRSTRQSNAMTSPPAADEVGGDRERRAREADERRSARERPLHASGCLEDEPDGGLHVDRREAPDLCLVAQGAPDEGALAPGELEPDVERLDDQENIGEQDRGIDAQTVDGLERHFRRGLGVPAELEEPEPLAHRTVLRQVAARLAHEPDGGVRHRRAARGAQERSIWK